MADNSDNLPKLYRIVGVVSSGERRACIVIRRKPSQIPFQIEMTLLKLAGISHNDGPNNMVIYEFMFPVKLIDALEFLHECGWTKIGIKETELGDFWVCCGNNEKSFRRREEAEEYVDALMLGKLLPER